MLPSLARLSVALGCTPPSTPPRGTKRRDEGTPVDDEAAAEADESESDGAGYYACMATELTVRLLARFDEESKKNADTNLQTNLQMWLKELSMWTNKVSEYFNGEIIVTPMCSPTRKDEVMQNEYNQPIKDINTKFRLWRTVDVEEINRAIDWLEAMIDKEESEGLGLGGPVGGKEIIRVLTEK